MVFGFIGAYFYGLIFTLSVCRFNSQRLKVALIMAGFAFVVSCGMSNHVMASINPILYYPIGLVSLWMSAEFFFLTLILPCIGLFLGVFSAVYTLKDLLYQPDDIIVDKEIIQAREYNHNLN